MKKTKWQQKEKENLEWFCPTLFKNYQPKDGDFEEYLSLSERGKKPRENYINPYIEAKRWRGITIHELYGKDFGTESWFGWNTLLREEDGYPIPKHIKNYLKKEILRGIYAETIERVYQDICSEIKIVL